MQQGWGKRDFIETLYNEFGKTANVIQVDVIAGVSAERPAVMGRLAAHLGKAGFIKFLELLSVQKPKPIMSYSELSGALKSLIDEMLTAQKVKVSA